MSRLILLAFALALVSCGSEPTQQEKYDDVISGISYRTYKATAGKTSSSVIEIYNEQKPDSIAPLKEGYAHILLGYTWSVSGQSAMAFAEADLAEESAEPEINVMAVALRAITMYEMGLDSLGKKESHSIRKHISPADSSTSYQIITFYLILGVAKAYEGSFDESKFFWAGFANETDIHWPYQLMDAVADFKKGEVQQALKKLKVLSQDASVPVAMRNVLAGKIKEIEENAGDVDSPLFWPRLISKTVYEQLKESTSTQLNKVFDALPVK